MLNALALAFSVWLVLGFQSAPSSKPERPVPSCGDDNGVDRCSEKQQRRVRELFGVKPIEEHQAAGDQVRRVFYVDGYGQDLVAISFIRPPGGDPLVQVRFPRREGETDPGSLEAAVPDAAWQDVVQRSSFFDRTLKALPEEEDMYFCLHSWVFTIEATDPPEQEYRERAPAPRRKTGNACHDPLVTTYAGEVERAAIGLFPVCAALDADQHRNEATQLSACRLLRGDRFAAARVLNKAGVFHQVFEPGAGRLLRSIFASDAVIDWGGERNGKPVSASDFWASKVADGGRTNISFDSVQGETARRVRLRGFLSRSREVSETRSVYERAPVEQVWSARNGNDFQVESATVGAFAIEKPR